MKTAIVYNKNDYKLSGSSYSPNYKAMFDALCEKFNPVHIHESAKVDADIVIFYDPHSSHHVDIETNALKYEYYNDPHQNDFSGRYANGPFVRKLGARKRSIRSINRKIDYIICPSKFGYNKYIKPYLGDRLVWFPVAPKKPSIEISPIENRNGKILANGHTWVGNGVFNPYSFRKWVYSRPEVTYIPHCGVKSDVPSGEKYINFLAQFSGSIAACDVYVVAKYLEIPLAGCVCFAQYLPEYEEMGFVHGKNCIYVNEHNFEIMAMKFKNNIQQYQAIADKGKLMAENWTSDKFADFIYNHARKQL